MSLYSRLHRGDPDPAEPDVYGPLCGACGLRLPHDRGDAAYCAEITGDAPEPDGSREPDPFAIAPIGTLRGDDAVDWSTVPTVPAWVRRHVRPELPRRASKDLTR